MSDSETAAAPPPKPARARAAAPAAARRRPGRPPSKPPAPPLEKRGVVSQPHDAANRFEFAYSDPGIFKSLFGYLKSVRAREVHVRCGREGLTFFANDHARKSRIVAHIAGAAVHWYYCEAEFWLAINRESVEKMFSAIDKSFCKISMTQLDADRERLVFTYKDPEIEKECVYCFTLSTHVPDQELYEAEEWIAPERIEELYDVEFQLTSKQFKKSVSDASNYFSSITIEKFGASPLQIVQARAGVEYTEVYRSPAKIHLRSTVPDDGVFRTTVDIDNVKALATAQVADTVRVLCCRHEHILFQSVICEDSENTLVVNTLTRAV